MIRKIHKISGVQGSGILNGWSMSPGTKEFDRINVIYGGNGSGKSTLARVFAQVAEQGSSEVDVHADVSGSGETTRRVKSSEDSFWDRLRVFNEEFVDRNLLFDVDGRSDAMPLLVLGEPNVERDKRLAEINLRLKSIPDELSETQTASELATGTANKLATATARTIGQELQPVGGRYDSRRYSARQVKETLASVDPESENRSDSEMSADLRVVQGPQMEPVGLIQRESFDLEGLQQQVIGALEQSVTSTALDELLGDSDTERWVQRGLQLHEHRDKCHFCANQVTPERRRALESHFDESFKSLQRQISALDQSLGDELAMVTAQTDSAPDRARLYPDLRDDYDTRVRLQQRAVAEYQERITALKAALAEKRAAPFSFVSLDQLPGSGQTSFQQINDLLDQHNARSTNYQKTIADAAQRIERGRLAAVKDAYFEHSSEAEAKLELAAELRAEQKSLQEESAGLSVMELDASPLAKELTRDIALLLGRDELIFKSQEGRYSIERHGEPATRLSEGERTAISLLYFLSSLRDERTKNLESTVVIDDPVSSLDHEILVGVSSYLWSALVGNSSKHQIILLTHSFELFRMWSNQLDRLPSKIRKHCPYSIYELRVRYDASPDGKLRRSPVLLSWTNENLRAKLRSQYHYLFWRIANVLHEDDSDGDLAKEMEATAIIPNAARQLLEAFLAFKYPSQIGDFEGSMRRAFEQQNVADPLRQRITRFVHRQSHNEEANIDRPTGIGESVTVLRSVFQFIEAVDTNHFTEMCSALELSTSVVLLRTPGEPE